MDVVGNGDRLTGQAASVHIQLSVLESLGFLLEPVQQIVVTQPGLNVFRQADGSKVALYATRDALQEVRRDGDGQA